MAQYIDKSVVVAEIERRINKEIQSCTTNLGYSQGFVDSMRNLLSFFDTLKTKEVDLGKEINLWVEENTYNGYCSASIHETAEHFFEFGLKTQRKEVMDDQGTDLYKRIY